MEEPHSKSKAYMPDHSIHPSTKVKTKINPSWRNLKASFKWCDPPVISLPIARNLSEEDNRVQSLEHIHNIHYTNITGYVEEKENMRHNQEVNQSLETDWQAAQISEFAGIKIRSLKEQINMLKILLQ